MEAVMQFFGLMVTYDAAKAYFLICAMLGMRI